MKKGIGCLLVLITLFAGMILQAEETGGIKPFLASCCIGPRVGLEMNEGEKVTTSEKAALIGQIVGPCIGGCLFFIPPLSGCTMGCITLGTRGYMAYDMGAKENGITGFFASCCLGPRVGAELGERKIRIYEWLSFNGCCIGRILTGFEAFQGKTMTEIEVKEGLRK